MTRSFNIILSAFALIFAPEPAQGQNALPKRSRRTPITDVFEATRDAVVNISTTKFVRVRSSLPFDSFFGDVFFVPESRPQVQKRTSVGSGFLIHHSGYIVTNAHVVHRTAEQKVIMADETEYDAKLITTDRQHDLAILKINADRKLPYLRLGRSDDLIIGETVIAIGNALGYQHSLTTGVLMGGLALGGIVVTAFDAPVFWEGFRARAWPLVGLSALGGFGSLAALWWRRTALSRSSCPTPP